MKKDKELFQFKKVDGEIGEAFQFRYENMVHYLLKALSLHEIAIRESAEMFITLDGAELCKDLSHLTLGVKITDDRVIDPWVGSQLAYNEAGVFGKLFQMQSRNYCFIFLRLF